MQRSPLSRRAGDRSQHAIAAAGIAISMLIIGACAGDTAEGTLSDAVEASDEEVARALLATGADPDEPRTTGLTPLMRAAARDDASMAEVLLGGGADLEATDPAGLTPAHVAAQANSAATLEVLVAAGADLAATSSDGFAAIHHAAALGSVEVIEILHSLGTDIDARSEATTQGHGYPRDVGPTALSVAVRAGQITAAEMLLALGAEVDAASDAGHTPLLVAVFSSQSPEVVALLLAAGADPRIQVPCERGCSAPTGDALQWAVELDRSDLVPLLGDAAGP
jgi:ankyrin repeat protein